MSGKSEDRKKELKKAPQDHKKANVAAHTPKDEPQKKPQDLKDTAPHSDKKTNDAAKDVHPSSKIADHKEKPHKK